MTRWLMIFFSTIVFALTACAGVAEQWTNCEYSPGRLIVDFAPSVNPRVPAIDSQGIVRIGISSLDAIFEEFEVSDAYRLVPDGILARLKTPPDLYRTYVLFFRSEYPVLNVLERLVADANVTQVTPDLIYHTCRVPNDALWNSQWDKRLIGADIVWDVSVGSSDVIMCAIDTGTDWNHPDLGMVDTLQPGLGWVLWVNPDEDLDDDGLPYSGTDYPGDIDDLDGLDNGSNGYVDDFLGWDFVYGQNCATGEDCDSQTDNNMFGLSPHGTHVGGIMTAHGNNGIGVAGVNWDGRLMALRAGYLHPNGIDGYLQHSATIAATYYAAANGAKILNMSFGGSGSDPAFQTAINTAWNQGCIIVAASGNDGDAVPNYPAAYQNVIAVNSVDSDDGLSWFSCYGTWTDICSPGGDPGVWSTVINGYEGGWVGTSMASPNAAGVAGLLWSIFPTMTNVQIRDLVLNSAEDITAENPGIPPNYLHGRVDARNALATLYPRLSVTGTDVNDNAPGDGDNRLENGETAQLVFTVSNDSSWSNATDISVTLSTTDSNLTITNENFVLGNIAAGQSADNQSDPVSISASGIDGAYWAELTLDFSSPSGYHAAVTSQLRVGRGEVLLVDDDGTHSYQTFYEAAIERVYLTPDIWSPTLDGDLPIAELSQYSTVVWSCGDESSSTLTTADRDVLSQFLDNGGNLLLVGQNIPEDIGNSSFHTDYLHAQDQDSTGNRQLIGIDGNPISNGTSLLLLGGGCAGNGTVGPSRIAPLNGGEATYVYTEGGFGAVHYSGTYKVVYFACALEAACGLGGSTHQEIVVENIFNWFGIITGIPSSPQDNYVPTALTLNGNYPNPFNPTTTISFDVPVTSRVALKVYDVLGREAATLVDATMSAGSHQVLFDATNLSSGVYIARLTSGSNTVSSKMILMK